MKTLVAIFLCAGLLLCSCAPFPYREKGLEPVDAKCTPELYSKYSDGQKIEDDVLTGPQGDCWKRSLEEHVRYDLMFVEFDDQGWVQQSSNLARPGADYLDLFFAQLEKVRAKYRAAGRGISLVVYVHGWHHNAGANDGNVRNFRKLLGDAALAEGQAGTERRVVGIYVGWRGDSLTPEWLNWITFWDRKNSAERVAIGMVREFFSRLDYFRDRVERKANQVTRMLVIGHSFGGLIVYESLSGEFLRTAARYHPEDEGGACPKPGTRPHYLTRFGDLVVIANPAFEGTRYEPLKISAQRLKCLDETQLPLVIIATSQADLATKNAFPIARYLGTIFEWAPDEEEKANVRTVGHNPRYTTHNLSLCAKDDVACANACRRAPIERPTAQGAAKLPYTIEQRKEYIAEEQTRIATIQRRGLGAREYFCGSEGEPFNLLLTTEGQWTPKENPFWVVHTSGDIMGGHNDIFNPRFEAFVRQMYIRALSTSEKTGRQAAE